MRYTINKLSGEFPWAVWDNFNQEYVETQLDFDEANALIDELTAPASDDDAFQASQAVELTRHVRSFSRPSGY